MSTLRKIKDGVVWAAQWFVKREPAVTQAVALSAATGLFTALGLDTSAATSVAASLVPLVLGALLRAVVTPPWPAGTSPTPPAPVAPVGPVAPPFPTPPPAPAMAKKAPRKRAR